MNTLEAIFNRRSVRKFTQEAIGNEALHTILRAGMSGPSAINSRPWRFLVVKDPATLQKMADGNGSTAEPLRQAVLGILVLGDLERAIERAPEFWVIDASIACQNMLLAATELGIGSVWLGTWPVKEKVEAQRRLFSLPETVVPHSILAFGYPEASQKQLPSKGGYEEDRVRFEKW